MRGACGRLTGHQGGFHTLPPAAVAGAARETIAVLRLRRRAGGGRHGARARGGQGGMRRGRERRIGCGLGCLCLPKLPQSGARGVCGSRARTTGRLEAGAEGRGKAGQGREDTAAPKGWSASAKLKIENSEE